jgi:hypothetical protein
VVSLSARKVKHVEAKEEGFKSTCGIGKYKILSYTSPPLCFAKPSRGARKSARLE